MIIQHNRFAPGRSRLGLFAINLLGISRLRRIGPTCNSASRRMALRLNLLVGASLFFGLRVTCGYVRQGPSALRTVNWLYGLTRPSPDTRMRILGPASQTKPGPDPALDPTPTISFWWRSSSPSSAPDCQAFPRSAPRSTQHLYAGCPTRTTGSDRYQSCCPDGYG